MKRKARGGPALAKSEPPAAPLKLHILDGAEALVGIDSSCFAAVVPLLSRRGRVVIVDFDESTRQLVFYEQTEWLRAGRSASDTEHTAASERREALCPS